MSSENRNCIEKARWSVNESYLYDTLRCPEDKTNVAEEKPLWRGEAAVTR